MANYLVTGAAGASFVGAHLAKQLRDDGHGVWCPWEFQRVQFDRLPKIDAVFHQAAITDPQSTDAKAMFQVNHKDAVALFKRAIAGGVKRIVYASSAAVYGDGPTPFREDQQLKPLTPYAKSKAKLDAEAMQLAEKNPGVKIVGLRYCNVYGLGEQHKKAAASVVSQLLWQMRRGDRPRIFTDGEQSREWVYVKDVVAANIAAAKAKRSEIYNVGGGFPVTFNKVVQILNRVLGTKLEPEYIPNPYTGSYQSRTHLDLAKTLNGLKWGPAYGLEQALTEMVHGTPN